MNTRHLIDPELLPVLDMFPVIDFDAIGLDAVRAGTQASIAAVPRPDLPVTVEEVTIPAGRHGPAMRALLLTPQGVRSPAAILHIHGGGYVLGNPEISLPNLMSTAFELGCIIVSPDYRLAPETRFPGPVEDCYAALGWLHGRAGPLGIDVGRIAVMGESAGGGLAAALALLARDRGEYRLAFQLLDAPMIDDRTCVREPHPYSGEFVFNVNANRFGWQALLGTEPGGPDVSPYAAAARATDLAGLPPTFIATGALDLFLEEDVDYALRLSRAGVQVELHVYPGCFHGFGIAQEAGIAKEAVRHKYDALRRALGIAAV